MCRQAGVTRAATIEEAFEAAATFATQPLPAGPAHRGDDDRRRLGGRDRRRDHRATTVSSSRRCPTTCSPRSTSTSPPRWSRNNPIDLAGGETRDTIPHGARARRPPPRHRRDRVPRARASSRTRRGCCARRLLPRSRPRADRRVPRAPGRSLRAGRGRHHRRDRQADPHRDRARGRRARQSRPGDGPRDRAALLPVGEPGRDRAGAPAGATCSAGRGASPDPPAAGARTCTRARNAPRGSRVWSASCSRARADPAPATTHGTEQRGARSRDTVVVAAPSVSALFVDAVAAGRFATALATVIAPFDACVSVDNGGGALVRIDPARALAAASTQKLLVAAAALSVLGSTHRFTTRAVVTAAPPHAGELAGDLVVVGGGDPVLTSDAAAPQPSTSLARLADAIVARGRAAGRRRAASPTTHVTTARARCPTGRRAHRRGRRRRAGALVVNGGRTPGGSTPCGRPRARHRRPARVAPRGAGRRSRAANATPRVAPGATSKSPMSVTDPRRDRRADAHGEQQRDGRAPHVARSRFGRRGRNDHRRYAHGRRQRSRASASRRPISTSTTARARARRPGHVPAALLGVIDLTCRPAFAGDRRGLAIVGETGTLASRSSARRSRDGCTPAGHIDGVVGLAGLVGPGIPSAGVHFAFIANGDFSTDGAAASQDEDRDHDRRLPDAPAAAALVPAPEATR